MRTLILILATTLVVACGADSQYSSGTSHSLHPSPQKAQSDDATKAPNKSPDVVPSKEESIANGEHDSEPTEETKPVPEEKKEPTPPSPKVYNPLDEIKFIDVPNYGGVQNIGAEIYTDVIGHTDPRDPYNPRGRGLAFDLYSVKIHETCHMLHAQISMRNPGYDGVYYKEGHAFLLKKSAMPTIRSFRDLVTQFLRSNSDYQLYLVQQPNTQPTLDRLSYLFDEWSCYMQNGKVTWQLEKAGRPESVANGGRGSDNAHSFVGYVATAMYNLSRTNAVIDPQLKAGFALIVQETATFAKAAQVSADLGPNIKKHWAFYRSNAAFSEPRNVIIKLYGQAWWDQVLSGLN